MYTKLVELFEVTLPAHWPYESQLRTLHKSYIENQFLNFQYKYYIIKNLICQLSSFEQLVAAGRVELP